MSCLPLVNMSHLVDNQTSETLQKYAFKLKMHPICDLPMNAVSSTWHDIPVLLRDGSIQVSLNRKKLGEKYLAEICKYFTNTALRIQVKYIIIMYEL